MNSLSVSTLAATVVPVLFVLVLGYIAGRRHRFTTGQAAGISHLALNYALPAALLASMLKLQRSQIAGDLPVLAALLLSYVGTYVVVFVLLRRREAWGDDGAAIAALLVTFPAAPVFGQAVLTPLFGLKGPETVGMIALVCNLTLTPATLVILARNVAKEDASSNSSKNSDSHSTARVVGKALKSPLVVAPVVGVVAALAGLPQSPLFESTLDLLGTASSGTAIFAAGLVLAAHKITVDRDVIVLTAAKMVLLPAFFAGLLLLFPSSAIDAPSLVGTALPSAVIGALLPTSKAKVRARAATTLFITSVAMVVIVPVSVLVGEHL